ncbi:MAG: single-stranded DNA-binding protein [Bacteroidales bacterium]|nr:single-stranded DNA-binding protein [Bacteroidales bacterium]
MTTLRNSVHLIGRLGNDPEMKNYGNDRTMARFSLATNEYFRNHEGKQMQETQWHNVVAWGKTAEIAEKILKKGKETAIMGKLINRSWEDDNGLKHYITEVVASEIVVFGKES